MHKSHVAAVGILLFSVNFAHADDACVKPKTSYDRTYCTAKLFFESDKELNEVYKQLTETMKPVDKKKLVGAQRNWIKFRNDACESRGTINVKCNYDVNRERAEFLRDRLRECKTGNCRDDLMFKEGWKTPLEG